MLPYAESAFQRTVFEKMAKKHHFVLPKQFKPMDNKFRCILPRIYTKTEINPMSGQIYYTFSTNIFRLLRLSQMRQ